MESFPTIEERLEHLLSRDYLYDDPVSYRAGVLAAADLLVATARPLEVAVRASA